MTTRIYALVEREDDFVVFELYATKKKAEKNHVRWEWGDEMEDKMQEIIINDI